MDKYFAIRIISGFLLTVFSLWWCGYNLFLLYEYHFTNILFLAMMPDWILLLNAGISVLGIILGVKILKQRIGIGKAYFYFILLFIFDGILFFYIS